MSQLYAINFQTHALENPLSDSSNWSSSTLQIANNECYGTGGSGAAGNGAGGATLSGPTLPSDQYGQFTLGGLSPSGTGPKITIGIRNGGNGALSVLINATGHWQLSETISGTPTVVASGTVTFASGDIFYLIAQGSTVTVAQNKTVLTTYTAVTVNTSNTQQILSTNAPSIGDVAAVFAYAAGSGNPLVWSAPDCRVSPFGPNNNRTVQGTSVFDVTKTDSRAAGAPVDSRAAGAPVDSRVSKPQNSRAPGTFGPNN